MGDSSIISTAINLQSDTVKLMLLTSSHTPNVDSDEFIDDVSANEVSASGTYSAGGGTLTKSSSTDDTNNVGVFDASDVSFTSATITARYAIVYKDTGTPSTSPIIAEYDFGTDKSSTAGTFAITIHASGLLTLA